MVSKRKFKRDYIILEAKDMNFRSKERVLPKAFAKIEINDENIEEITPCFEGNLRECAIHYISQFDVIEIIKVYDFLESYSLSYNLYDEAVKVFQQLSDQQNLVY